ncbi:MAG: helical backbone metal receptor [Candidatus Omnitrophota bacterium]
MKKIVTYVFIYVLFAASACFAGEEYRIVSLAPNATEILFSLDLGDSIVGVDEYSNFPEEAREIQKVGSFDKPNMEMITLLRPDIILVNTDLEKDKADYLGRLGARVIKISPKSVEGLCRDIESLGSVLGRETEAGFLAQDMRQRIRRISEDNGGKTRPKVFLQLFDDPLVTGSSFMGDIIDLAGGDNIARDVKDDAGIFSMEMLIDRNPDIILVMGFSDKAGFPGSINAVRNNRIYKDLNPDVFLRPGPRTIEAIERLDRIFHE